MKSDPMRYFIRRVIRSVRIRFGYLSLRIKFICGMRKPSCLKITIFPWSEFAGIPGSSDHLPLRLPCVQSIVTKNLADQVLNHTFNIFTDHPINVSIESPERKRLIANHCHGIDLGVLNSYLPIDWHHDFHSGYRWSPDLLFLDIKVAPLFGVDIKVPRNCRVFSMWEHFHMVIQNDAPSSL